MVKFSISLLMKAEAGLSKALTDILVCPISKKPLRHCEKSGTLISDAIGVSFPQIVDGIPCLVPNDGKILEIDVAEAHTSSMDNKGKE
uniref:Protein preY, mitochondrial n=1 Tax=Kalanchoe fedtschenkoi TaxID=63787 RepID=A0A7N0TNM5_KALFE